MRSLHVIIVHAKHLVYRKKFLSDTLKLLEEVCTKKAYAYSIHYIHEDELEETRKNIKEIEKQVEKYNGDDKIFADLFAPFTIEQISNFLKQRRALEKVIELDDDICMIIEDDCTIVPNFINNLEDFLENPIPEKWDILFLGIPNSSEENEIKDTRDTMKILPSKEIYCIHPATAKNILTHLQKLSFPYRIQLSYIIDKNKDIRSMYLTKRISIEGSKFGFYPSSVLENNLLIYNKGFVQLFNLLASNKEITLERIDDLYKAAEYLESPDIMHVYGVLLHKCNKYTEAKIIFEKALEQMKIKNGLITRRSELLNNTININALCQTV